MSLDHELRAKQEFGDFLDSSVGKKKYIDKLNALIAGKTNQLVVSLSDLREYDQAEAARWAEAQRPRSKSDSLAFKILNKPVHQIMGWNAAIKAAALKLEADPATSEMATRNVSVAIGGPFGDHLLSPRSLNASFLSRLVCLEGLVTRASHVHSKMQRTVHYCAETRRTTAKVYRDDLSLDASAERMPTYNRYPERDLEGHAQVMLPGESTFSDYQSIVLQELPECAPIGQMPRSCDCVLEGELADVVKPGDRVRITGVYRAHEDNTRRAASDFSEGVSFRTVVLAVNVEVLGAHMGLPCLTRTDVEHIMLMSKRPNVLSLLASAVAPSVYGIPSVKEGILLLLAGGVERVQPNTRIRGDVNILLLGEPSTAKSQLLRCVQALSPVAISTTGRGASGVGLTAAVVLEDNGQVNLTAGAMVLGDRGVVCIDEIDKMSVHDRVAVHEALEQGTVTVAKAGVYAQLNARCSVLAAANPVYGFYNTKISLAANIGLPESLLSRFDLIFVLLDSSDSVYNRRLADQVITNHRDGNVLRWWEGGTHSGHQWQEEAKTGAVPVIRKIATGTAQQRTVVSPQFLKKYFLYVREHCHPVMSNDEADPARVKLVDAYVEFRAAAKRGGPIVTPRVMEALVRLAHAHARLRLSSLVQEVDADVAIRLVSSSVIGSSLAVVPQGEAAAAAGGNNAAAAPRAEGDAAPPAPPAAADAAAGGAADAAMPPDASDQSNLRSLLLRIIAQSDANGIAVPAIIAAGQQQFQRNISSAELATQLAKFEEEVRGILRMRIQPAMSIF